MERKQMLPININEKEEEKKTQENIFAPYPEEYALWEKTKTPEALGAIIKLYEPLIASEARKYADILPLPAAISHGKKHAIQAVKSYDPLKNVKLSTWITNYLKQLHRLQYKFQQAVRMPENLQMLVGKYKRAIGDLKFKLGREPSNIEISEEIKKPLSVIKKLNSYIREEFQESALAFDPGVIEPEDPRIAYVHHDLGPMEQVIFEHSTGFGGRAILTKKKIAEKLKISPSKVTIIAKDIAEKIEQILGAKQ